MVPDPDRGSGDRGPWGHSTVADGVEYPLISDYAAVGDCRTVALVSRQGSLDWLCLPHFSAPSVFAALLDRSRGGRFAVRPSAPFQVRRRYIGNTNVLETTFVTATGKFRMIDAMPIVHGSRQDRELQPQSEVLRILEGVEGEVDLELIYEPRPNYAQAKIRLARRGALGWTCAYRDQVLVLHSDVLLQLSDDEAALRGLVRIQAGERRYLSLTYTQRDIAVIAPLGVDAERRLRGTLDWWESWSRQCTVLGSYRDQVVRSILALKLLTYALSGAVVAAPTTSLPEAIGGNRNWDYRFCWLRDAALTLHAFLDLRFEAEGKAFVDWLLHATRLTWPELQVVYDVYGEPRLSEKRLDHLEGYQRSKPVRIGNAAHDQLQLDVYGAVTLAVSNFVERGDTLDRSERRLLEGFGRTVCRRWREADEGIWEIRAGRRQHTYSKVMCWAALDCLVRLHEKGHLPIPVEEFRRQRTAIRDAIENRGFNRRLNSYVSTFDGADPDASLMLLPRYGYVEASDPRMAGTQEFIERMLCRNGLLYRYAAGDGLPPGEGAFGIASFWAVDLLARQGRVDDAVRRFEHVLSYANDVGLFGEEIDVETGLTLGNFPQAFTHVGLITAALSLARAQATSPVKG